MTTTSGFYLTELQLLTVTGGKAAVFLHGQFTNALKDLQPGHGNYNLLLTNKGRIRADADVLNLGDRFAIIAVPAALDIIREHLAKLAPLSGCRLNTVPDTRVWHVAGAFPGITENWVTGEIRPVEITRLETRIYRSDRLGCEGYDIIAEHLQAENFPRWACAAGFNELTPQQVELTRLKNGVPRWGVDFDETCLPQEALLDRALNFEKGCYLGQEIVARLKYRGHVNRVLAKFSLTGRIAENQRAVHDADGREVGRITSMAYDPDADTTYVLAFVAVVVLDNGVPLFIAGKPLIATPR